jgi:hypothetical protein
MTVARMRLDTFLQITLVSSVVYAMSLKGNYCMWLARFYSSEWMGSVCELDVTPYIVQAHAQSLGHTVIIVNAQVWFCGKGGLLKIAHPPYIEVLHAFTHPAVLAVTYLRKFGEATRACRFSIYCVWWGFVATHN